MTEHAATASASRNRRTAFGLFAVAAGMLVVAFAAVPLYATFQRSTGFGGTARLAASNTGGTIARTMTTSFDANVDKGLAWTVTPAATVTDPIGTTRTVTFKVTSNAATPTTGKAVFNVTPQRAGGFVTTTHCFCNSNQTLAPGETLALPVTFFIDPEIAGNDDLHTVKDITLSYTFYADDKKGS